MPGSNIGTVVHDERGCGEEGEVIDANGTVILAVHDANHLGSACGHL